ncbi:unnamed protein product [Amoebophrya sp. A120]|nr:unnamed protein product [Amoebophrya sp. A120]|eukprot:GSA120T00009331001.1
MLSTEGGTSSMLSRASTMEGKNGKTKSEYLSSRPPSRAGKKSASMSGHKKEASRTPLSTTCSSGSKSATTTTFARKGLSRFLSSRSCRTSFVTTSLAVAFVASAQNLLQDLQPVGVSALLQREESTRQIGFQDKSESQSENGNYEGQLSEQVGVAQQDEDDLNLRGEEKTTESVRTSVAGSNLQDSNNVNVVKTSFIQEDGNVLNDLDTLLLNEQTNNSTANPATEDRLGHLRRSSRSSTRGTRYYSSPPIDGTVIVALAAFVALLTFVGGMCCAICFDPAVRAHIDHKGAHHLHLHQGSASTQSFTSTGRTTNKPGSETSTVKLNQQNATARALGLSPTQLLKQTTVEPAAPGGNKENFGRAGAHDTRDLLGALAKTNSTTAAVGEQSQTSGSKAEKRQPDAGSAAPGAGPEGEQGTRAVTSEISGRSSASTGVRFAAHAEHEDEHEV